MRRRLLSSLIGDRATFAGWNRNRQAANDSPTVGRIPASRSPPKNKPANQGDTSELRERLACAESVPAGKDDDT
jgi:hypothetical protein